MREELVEQAPALRERPYPAHVAFLQRLVTTTHTMAYRLTGGTIGGTIAGLPMLLLTTIGRRTNQLRTAPLLYGRDGDDLVIVASNGGAAKHPTWLLNLQARPRVLVQIGAERFVVDAQQASPHERDRLWPLMVGLYPMYAQYQARTERPIPVIVLRPCDDERPTTKDE
jgi:deazaflavin-dependent oxidoreductase (nitroreductase family)